MMLIPTAAKVGRNDPSLRLGEEVQAVLQRATVN
jgi:hypothetical protein